MEYQSSVRKNKITQFLHKRMKLKPIRYGAWEDKHHFSQKQNLGINLHMHVWCVCMGEMGRPTGRRGAGGEKRKDKCAEETGCSKCL